MQRLGNWRVQIQDRALKLYPVPGCKISLILCITQFSISKEKGLISGKSEAILLNMKINTRKIMKTPDFFS